MRNGNLWKKLVELRFDDGAQGRMFSDNLARVEGWSHECTLRVIEEYRKFIYLTQVSDSEIAPPVAVDRAWHLHLTYTDHYWRALCAETLGQPLHHDRGVALDGERVAAQFRDMCELYRAEFGTRPPDTIWRTADSYREPSTFIVGLAMMPAFFAGEATESLLVGVLVFCPIMLLILWLWRRHVPKVAGEYWGKVEDPSYQGYSGG